MSERNAFDENEPFTLQDCYLGPRAGRYVVRAEHAVQLKADKPEWKGDAEVAFDVTAPRLALPSQGVVHACYPPPDSEAPTAETLPYISLARRSLPWERSLAAPSPDATPAERATPWLALLVLDREDLRLGEIRTTTGAALANAADAARLYAPWTDPALADDFTLTDDERKTELTVLELDAARFRLLCPTPAETRSLAHVRSVDARAKRIGDEQAVAHYALVLANRIPRGGDNVAVLVSLEGWARWLGDASVSSAPKVRVVVLHRWQFKTRDGIGSCARWVSGRVDFGPLTVSRAILERAGGDEDRGPLAAGYVPVQWRPAAKDVAPSFGWYHGPFGVAPTAGFGDDTPTFENPDAALVIDARTGIVDHAYAAAWQVGRLAALSSASFAQALRSWSRGVFLEALRQEELRGGAAADASTAPLQTLADAIKERFQPGTDRARPADDVRVAAEWLADLQLLLPVPFRYLVPSDKLLPPESMRAFFIDGRWLDALADGAISIGVASLKNRAPLRSKRSSLRRVLRWLMLHRRALSRGEALPAYTESDASADATPLCGLLLRSELLKAFPGVEVELFGRTPDDKVERLAPLRIDMVADGVLLVIARGQPDRVVVREPREGLRFGLVSGRLYPRAATGERLEMPAFEPRTRGGIGGVLDVGAITASIGSAQKPAAGAQYALQWLLPPQDAVIRWEHMGR